MNKVFKETIPYLKDKYNEELTSKIMNEANKEYESLLEANKDEVKEVKKQTVNNIYPCISLYRAMQKEGISNSEALEFLDKTYFDRKKKEANSLSKLMHIGGLYKIYPSMFTKVTNSTFSKEAGFDPEFIIKSKYRSKFNMKKCLYCKICKREGVSELTKVFCHTDDAANESLHKKLIWHRTKTLSNNDECCDFDIFIRSLKPFTRDLNELCINLQEGEKEVVDKPTMLKAKEIVFNTVPNSNNEVLLYCAALNILNTYVKQDQDDIGYYFKKMVEEVLIDTIVKNKFKGVTFYLDKDKGNSICYIKIYHLIFSFHGIKLDEDKKVEIMNHKSYKKIRFDNVKKQRVAVTLFNNALIFNMK